MSMKLRAMVDELWRDVAYAWRMLGRNPAFTAVAALTLALGVGANTAVFSVVDAVVFRQAPYEEPERLVKIWSKSSPQPTDNLSGPSSRRYAACAISSWRSRQTMGRAWR
jgi:hypothetical protein